MPIEPIILPKSQSAIDDKRVDSLKTDGDTIIAELLKRWEASRFDFDNPIEVADLSQRGVSEENDKFLDELEAWEKFHADSERLTHIDPDSTHHYS